MTDKEKDNLVWLYTHGVHVRDIAASLKMEMVVVQDVLTRILQGREPFTPSWSRLAFEHTDWSLREEWILRFMRAEKCPPGEVAALLGRQPDTIKRKWKEMKERDVALSQELARRRIELITTKDGSGGLEKPKARQASFF